MIRHFGLSGSAHLFVFNSIPKYSLLYTRKKLTENSSASPFHIKNVRLLYNTEWIIL